MRTGPAKYVGPGNNSFPSFFFLLGFFIKFFFFGQRVGNRGGCWLDFSFLSFSFYLFLFIFWFHQDDGQIEIRCPGVS